MYKNDHKLFYFKKTFSEKELERLVTVENFSQAKDNKHIYISGNHNTGVLYVIENVKEDKEISNN